MKTSKKHAASTVRPVMAMTAIAAACFSLAAYAQDTTDATASAPAPAPAPAADRSKVPEVVVTAQKRAQSVIKTPVAMTAVSGDDLRDAGAVNAAALTSMAPNVVVGEGGRGSTEISIRGIASANNTETGDPAAGFFIDGNYVGRSQGAGAAFFDIERVEVLRGPQGTLYGRNTTAGAVNVITNKPTDKNEGAIYVQFGNYNTRMLEAMANTRVNDVLALRAALSTNDHDGYIDSAHAPQNGFSHDRDDAKKRAFRIHGLLKFTPSTSLLVTLDSNVDKGTGPGSVPYATLAANSSGGAGRTENPVIEGKVNDRSSGLSTEFKTSTALGELTALASRRDTDKDQNTSFGDVKFPLYDKASFTQDQLEVRLGSAPRASLQWVLGTFVFRETGDVDFAVPAPGPNAHYVQRMTSNSKALFGQATYAIMPGIRLTAGARYSKDDKSRVGTTYVYSTGLPNYLNDASVSYAKVTGRLGLDVDLNPQLMAYASFATGYKAGGMYDGTTVTVNGATLQPVYQPENMKALEAGLKGRFLENRLQVSAALFRNDYRDMQLSAYGLNAVATALTHTPTYGNVTQNAGRARSQGFELDGRARLTASDDLNFSLGLLDAKYLTYKPSATVDWAGKKLDKAPSTTFNLGYTHTWDLESGAELKAYAGTKYSSSYVLSNFGTAQFTQSAFHRSEARLSYRTADEKWQVQGFVKNIEDRNVAVSYVSVGGNSVFLSDPRTFGVRVGHTF
jgi:iron complex outermembrane receptor protein